jgi:mannitol-1-phosphate 5-dehydrogenase
MKKMVLFGAGKIGRSFIGQLFSAGGFDVVFVDVYKPVIDELNRRREYKVVIKSESDSVISVKNVKGIFAGDELAVIKEIIEADLVATAVGQNGLPGVFPLLAKGLENRRQKHPDKPLDIIMAENLRNSATYFEKELKKLLPASYPFNQLVGLVETSIGKMVPIMTKKDMEEDPLKVFAEPYNTLIVDKKAFKKPIPQIAGLAPKENIKAWVDRKLFIHNLGHAAAAYLGYLYNPQFVYLYEALEVPEIFNEVKATMQQSANALLKKYPDDFTSATLDNHIDDLLSRFQNRALGDTIFRVGSDLPRKLGPNDRLAGAIRLAQEMNSPYDKILVALICGCRFRATDENGKLHLADESLSQLYQSGLKNVLLKICKFDEISDKKLIEGAEKIDRKMAKKRRSPKIRPLL